MPFYILSLFYSLCYFLFSWESVLSFSFIRKTTARKTKRQHPHQTVIRLRNNLNKLTKTICWFVRCWILATVSTDGQRFTNDHFASATSSSSSPSRSLTILIIAQRESDPPPYTPPPTYDINWLDSPSNSC